MLVCRGRSEDRHMSSEDMFGKSGHFSRCSQIQVSSSTLLLPWFVRGGEGRGLYLGVLSGWKRIITIRQKDKRLHHSPLA